MKKIILLVVSHLLTGIAGFALGIYALPILTAPDAPPETEVVAAMKEATFQGQFQRDLKGSDFLHWGEGTVSISNKYITLQGNISPGPDYKLYLSPQFVETEDDFQQLKSEMIRVGDVKTFENFIVPVSESIDLEKFNTVIIWCESFGEFITAASYR